MSPPHHCPHCGGPLDEPSPELVAGHASNGASHSDELLPDTSFSPLVAAESHPGVEALLPESAFELEIARNAELLADSVETPALQSSPPAPLDPRFDVNDPIAWKPATSHGSNDAISSSAPAPELEPDSGSGRPDLLKSWSMLVMTSYASALTLALCWLLVTGRIRWGPIPRADTASLEKQAQPSLPALPPATRLELGKTARVGNLELTPVEIRADSVWLRNITTQEPTFRKGGIDSFWLRLKVRNVAGSETFAPLEAALLRETVQGRSDALIETETDHLPMFPLAQSSEWVVDGEELPKVAPGEEAELLLASVPGAARKASDRMTWRLRVRTSVDQTELIGIRFTRSDVK